MKAKLFLIALCALSLSSQAQEVKKDTVDKYVIDREPIEQFDGSRLIGKTISKYSIEYHDLGHVVLRQHSIFTGDNHLRIAPTSSISIRTTTETKGPDPLIVVDDKEITNAEMSRLTNEDIAEVFVYKPGSKAAESYGDKGKNGVVYIKTKAAKGSANIYIVDDKKMTEAEVKKIPSDKIASVTVSKKEGNQVILITTKR